MLRLAALTLLVMAGAARAVPVDFDTAATVYRDAAIREQVRASLVMLPGQIRRLFESDRSTPLNAVQLDAVTAAAKRGFRIDVFETPALAVFAANLDPATVKKTELFLGSDLGKRMVAADVAVAIIEQKEIDRIMNGDVPIASNPQRDAVVDKIEAATRSAQSAVQIFLTMGTAVAIGTAVGSGGDPGPVGERSRQAGEETRGALEENMRLPLRRYLAYGYRDLSEKDLKKVLAFLESNAGKRYISAYVASMDAGFSAMGRRCGEQLGESLREMAQAQLATTQRDDIPMALPRH